MLLDLIDLFIWLVGLLGVLVAWTLFWRRALALPEGADEIHFVTTDDGWRLGMGRYRPKSAAEPRLPVVLCHGLGANRFNMDFGERRSLARYLAAQGFECWVPELRGAGRSAAPPGAGRQGCAWDFDTLVLQDVPAVVRTVCERSGAARVHWVGHSLGGLVLFGHLAATEGDPRIASVFAIASPGDGTLVRPSVRSSLAALDTISRWFGSLGLSVLAGLAAPFGGLLVYAPQPGPLVNPDNVEPWVARRALAHLATDLNLRLLRQMSRWAFSSEPGFTTYDGGTNYLSALSEVTTPAFFAAGAADGVVLPDSVRAAFDAWGGQASEFHIFGRNHGARIDYGHGDLLVGAHAPSEVFPCVRDWLVRQESEAARPSEPAPEDDLSEP